MFGGKQANPYDEIVTKTTDENLTSENWELILNLCDKVNDEGEQGARSVIAAVLKRLAHRSPNVQLYALALAEALSKNCGTELHREMASRSFTQGLEKLVTDRMTHEKVKRRALYLISLWTGEFENNPQLGLMEELYNTLKGKNFKFERVTEPPPPEVDDEVRRKEEEELQRVLEMSVHDKGGRNLSAWGNSNATNAAGGSQVAASSNSTSLPGPSSSGGYTPTEPPRSAYHTSETHHQTSIPMNQPQKSPTTAVPDTAPPTNSPPEQSSSPSSQPTATNSVTRVRALHTFEPTVAGELAFEKGDIIKVTDRAYDNWWRGQLRGRTGIFPVNYVEPLPDLTPQELAREAEQEAAVFAQAANIDKLITMLRGLDPAKDNLADNEEIQELYRSSMSLRPKIVKLIDKYSQKRAELVAMNENFVKARGVFEQMMEDSLARHTGVYDNAQPTFRKARPESRANAADYRASTYGWNAAVYEQPGYNAYPAAPAAYGAEQAQPTHQSPYQGQPYADPNAYGGMPQTGVYGGQVPQGPQPYPPVDSTAYGPPQQQGSGQGPSPGPQSQAYGPTVTDPVAYTQQNPQMPSTQPQAQPQTQSQPQAQPQPQPQGPGQPQGQPQPESQPQQNSLPQQQQGPPYVFDPNMHYADPNVQAWAQYYAQGGTDLAGAVYFISIPGVTDAPATSSTQPAGGLPGPHSQSSIAASQPISNPQHERPPSAGSPSTAAQIRPHQPQGLPSTVYQEYGSPAQPTDPTPEHGRHPQLHIQPGYQSPNSTAPNGTASQVDPSSAHVPGSIAPSHSTPLGAPVGSAPQPYAMGDYPSGAPMQYDPRSMTSPLREAAPSYFPQSQQPPAAGVQQS